MADLNALIAQGYQFQAPPDPFVQYAKRQQLDQGEQTNQLNQMKMQEYQRGIQQQNALNQAYASAADPATGEIDYSKVRNAMALSGAGSQIPAIEEARSKQENAKLTRQKLQGEIESTGFEFKIKKANKAITDIASLSSPEEAISSIDTHVKNGDIDLNKATQLKTALAAAPSFGAWQKSMLINILDAKERLNANAPPPATNLAKLRAEKAALPPGDPGHAAYDAAIAKETQFAPTAPSAPPSMVAEYTFAKTPDGGNFKGSYQDFVTTRAAAGRAPAAPRAEQPPVAVIDPVTGNQVYVSREEALRGRMTPATGATGVKPLTEAQTIKLRTDVGKDYKNASTALSQIDDLLTSATSVKTAPGLSAATGFTGMLPSFSEGAAAQAETRLANLRGKVTALGKATASMGGAIGSIANQEWKILADQIAVLNEVKGKGPLLEQITLLEEQAKGASARIRDAYEKTRAEDFERFPQFRDLPAPKAPSGARVVSPNIDALLDKYLNK